MKNLVAVLFFLSAGTCGGQTVHTIVPKQPVVIGNAFQVQFVITNPSDLLSVSPPAFDSLRLVSGPNYYKGRAMVDGKMQPIENITYTLVPTRLGVQKIGGITVSFRNAQDVSAGDAFITVTPLPKASFSSRSSYTDVSLYAPASRSDLQALIDENLFIKTEVSKRSCYIGEPVVAIFKLYSRLQSTSEVINAPSLYGFSVLDVLNIYEAHTAVETIGGKVFNTSVLRKLQLYPSESGKLLVDEMQLQNEIEFVDSLHKGGKIKFEKQLASEPVVITVSPLPGKKPENYTGAVGRFTIQARANPDKLMITVSGKGNFIQFGPPHIAWPPSFEVFDSVVTDELDKNHAPVAGKRTYSFSFTADSAATYILPPVSFSFFDPGARTFKTVHSNSVRLNVASVARRPVAPKEKKQVPRPVVWRKPFLLAIAVLGIILFFFLFFRNRKNTPAVSQIKPRLVQSLENLSVAGLTDQETCIVIQKTLSEAQKAYTLSEQQRGAIQLIRDDCQMLAYSSLGSEGRKEELIQRALRLLREIEG